MLTTHKLNTSICDWQVQHYQNQYSEYTINHNHIIFRESYITNSCDYTIMNAGKYT